MNETKSCWSCGLDSGHVILTSTNAFGAYDLDWRPPPQQRNTMHAWLQVCPHCGYVAEDLAALPLKPEIVQNAMKRPAWTQPTSGPSNGLVMAFRRRALISAAVGNNFGAASASLWAAWVSDDAGNEPLAIECRLEAARLFQLSFAGMDEGDQRLKDGRARLVDILRRACAWDIAEITCANSLTLTPEGITRKILLFQKDRIERHDASRYTISRKTSKGANPDPDRALDDFADERYWYQKLRRRFWRRISQKK